MGRENVEEVIRMINNMIDSAVEEKEDELIEKYESYIKEGRLIISDLKDELLNEFRYKYGEIKAREYEFMIKDIFNKYEYNLVAAKSKLESKLKTKTI